MVSEDQKSAISDAANALQAVVMLAARVRQRVGEQVEDTVQLEAAVARVANALNRLKPQGGHYDV